MKKIIFVIAAFMAISSTMAHAESGGAGFSAGSVVQYETDILITQGRSFRGEEITSDNQRMITVASLEQLRYDGVEFDAYIAAEGDSYRLIRREAR